MTRASFERRLARLEAALGKRPGIIVFCRKGETPEEACARYNLTPSDPGVIVLDWVDAAA